ncbi:MAG: class I SAM-dependent methyltransferase [Tenericutes bacterium]|jgi:ubiquinone/menaquinone biosynthesis C-methylase UbiE|nr:class I SAM-dependent methyltransferase [Mycoplasmatota bacterium]
MGKRLGSNFQFNLIAPIYGLFYKTQKRNYSRDLILLSKHLNVSKYNSIVDVGCGTGALCSVLSKVGISVTGVDPAKRMLKIGARKKENIDIEFINASSANSLPFEDKSFDLSVASYVAHGMKLDERKKLYEEMSRVSRHYVILYDYNDKRAVITNIIEKIERGDYFNFIKNVENELDENFESFEEIKLGNQASWYICKPLIIQ